MRVEEVHMRFLRLDFRDDLNSLDLHPLLTVVSALEPNHQRQLLAAVRRLSSGSTVGLRGLVEHQGLMLELDAAAGAPLAPLVTDAGVLVYVDGDAVRCEQVGLQAEIDQWERQADIDAAAVEEIRSHIDLSIRAKARQLGGGDGADGQDQARGENPTTNKLRVAAIRTAFEDVAAHQPTVSDCPTGVVELMADWEDYRRRRDANAEHLQKVETEVAEAKRQIRERTQALEEARDDAKPVLLTPEQESRLEALSDQSNEQSRLGMWKKSLSDEEEIERQELLQLVGVKSWTEYSVFRMSPTVRPDRQNALDEAETELAQAEQALQRATSNQAGDQVVSELQTELERMKALAEPYFGVLIPADLGAALKEQIVQIDNPDWVAAVNQLRDVLSSNDLHPPYGFEPSETLGWTEAWLRAEGSLDSNDEDEDEDEPDDDDEVSETERRSRLSEISRALARHNRALDQIDRAEAAAERSAQRVRELESQLQERCANPDAETAAEILSIVTPVAEQVLKEVGGSVPVAVVGELTGIPDAEVDALMSAMEEVAQQVQVIMITDHQGIQDWVGQAGLERAGHADGTGVLL